MSVILIPSRCWKLIVKINNQSFIFILTEPKQFSDQIRNLEEKV